MITEKENEIWGKFTWTQRQEMYAAAVCRKNKKKVFNVGYLKRKVRNKFSDCILTDKHLYDIIELGGYING